MSLRVLESKMEAVAATGADVLATANPGCLIQLDYGARRAGLPLRVRYVTDLWTRPTAPSLRGDT